MQSLIRLKHISAGYNHKTVLEDINLTVLEHDFLGIIGPNGGGKTTLVKLILGLLSPVSGTIHFYQEGKEVSDTQTDCYWYDAENMEEDDIAPNLYD